MELGKIEALSLYLSLLTAFKDNGTVIIFVFCLFAVTVSVEVSGDCAAEIGSAPKSDST